MKYSISLPAVFVRIKTGKTLVINNPGHFPVRDYVNPISLINNYSSIPKIDAQVFRK